MMQSLCADLLAECDELADLAAALAPAQWQAPLAGGGTPWDAIAQLLHADLAALDALRDPALFARGALELAERTGSGGETLRGICRELHGELDGPALVAEWRPVHARLCDWLAHYQPHERLPWWGGKLAAADFAALRLADCWAHAQDIWDMLRRRRPVHARLRHLAGLGVRRCAHAFAVHGEPAPESTPHVDLAAPGGSRWTWGEASTEELVRGPAEDFCLVVTQRRHAQDTLLEVIGPVSTAWMELAQVAPGPARPGPRPGQRRVDLPGGP